MMGTEIEHDRFAWYDDHEVPLKDQHALTPQRTYYAYDPKTNILHIFRRLKEKEDIKEVEVT